MDNRFLTPVQLWKGFEPLQPTNDVSYVTYRKGDGFVTASLFFTAMNDETGFVRAFAELLIPSKLTKKCVLFIGDVKDGAQSVSNYTQYADNGYLVARLDLHGCEGVGGNYTVYGGGYAYGNYAEARNLLYNATPSAEVNPYYLWVRVCRRFISYLTEAYPKVRPVVIGEGLSAPVLWQLGGTDERIDGIVSLLGTSFTSRPFRKDAVDENLDRWDTGIAPFAYARFLKCPSLSVTCSNSVYDELGSAKSMQDNAPEGSICDFLVSPLLSEQLYAGTVLNVSKWIAERFAKNEGAGLAPQLSYTVADAALNVVIDVPSASHKVASVELLYCYDEENPLYRSWNSKTVKPTEDGYFFDINLLPDCSQLFIYAVVSYKGGGDIATPVTNVKLSEEMKRGRLIKSQLIYDTSMDKKFFPVTSGLIVADDVLSVKKCPLGIYGISVSSGVLSSYIVGEDERISFGEALQFNAYAEESRQIEIRITRETENGVYVDYSTLCELHGQNIWQKITIEAGEFRDAELKPMAGWDNLKQIRFLSAENILFNNILWV